MIIYTHTDLLNYHIVYNLTSLIFFFLLCHTTGTEYYKNKGIALEK